MVKLKPNFHFFSGGFFFFSKPVFRQFKPKTMSLIYKDSESSSVPLKDVFYHLTRLHVLYLFPQASYCI